MGQQRFEMYPPDAVKPTLTNELIKHRHRELLKGEFELHGEPFLARVMDLYIKYMEPGV